MSDEGNTLILREGETPESAAQRIADEALQTERARVERGLSASAGSQFKEQGLISDEDE
jgi:hypothetical protein